MHHRRRIEAALLPLRHEHVDARTDHLQKVAIAGDDRHRQACGRRRRGERAHDIVGLEARCQRMPDSQMVQDLTRLRDLPVEVGDLLRGPARPTRPIVGIEGAAERRLRRVEGHAHMRGTEAAHQPEEGTGEAVDALNRRAVRPDDTPRQCIVGPVEEMVAVHQHEAICRVHTIR